MYVYLQYNFKNYDWNVDIKKMEKIKIIKIKIKTWREKKSLVLVLLIGTYL